MRLPSKPVWLLIGMHTLCLGIGFWFLCQLLASLTQHQANEASWQELESAALPLAEFAAAPESGELLKSEEANPRAVAQLRSLSRNLPNADTTGALLIGWGGNVLNPVSASAARDLKFGDDVAWHSDLNPASGGGGALRGWIKTPSGDRVALRYPVADASAWLIVYDGQPKTPAWRGILLASLPLAAGIAFLWTWVLSTVGTYLLSSRLNFEESTRKLQSEHDALRSAQDLLRTRDAVIFGLAKLAESRDPETGHHLERISHYSTCLATALRTRSKFHRIVTPGFVRLLGISSVLHDIGKVGLEDTVLLKPGRLNADERKKMQEHTLVAGACLREIEQRLGASNFLQTAREIALHHHERWDGNGYPVGLAGEGIPLAARIVTVADVYDVLSSKRVYKDAYSHEECVRLIREGAGTQFDPELVEVFLSIEADFAEISRRFAANQAAAAVTPTGELMTSEQEALLLNVVVAPKPGSESSERPSSVA